MIVWLLAAQILAAAPPLPPAEAAAVLARLESPANFGTRFVCTDCDGPRAVVIPSAAPDGPFGSFRLYCGYGFGPIRLTWSRIGRYRSTGIVSFAGTRFVSPARSGSIVRGAPGAGTTVPAGRSRGRSHTRRSEVRQ